MTSDFDHHTTNFILPRVLAVIISLWNKNLHKKPAIREKVKAKSSLSLNLIRYLKKITQTVLEQYINCIAWSHELDQNIKTARNLALCILSIKLLMFMPPKFLINV